MPQLNAFKNKWKKDLTNHSANIIPQRIEDSNLTKRYEWVNT
jgi:hypothetical protein